MDGTENRQIARDSLFLLADLRIEGLDGEHRIRVRNLSAGGMMGEGTVRVMRGTGLEVNLRNLGWVPGTVAWVQDNRFGVAFRDEIDPSAVRVPVAEEAGTDSSASSYRRRAPALAETPRRPLRKI